MTDGRWVEPITLEGSFVRLEPLSADHLPGLIEAGADPDIWTWMPLAGDSPERMRDLVRAALESAGRGTEVPFVTVERAGRRVAGSTRFLSIVPEHRRLEIGWTWLGEPWRRSMVNSEAKLLQLEHAFERLGAGRVEFKTDALNVRSRTALLAIGATFEGIFRRHMVLPSGRRRDSACFSIVDDEWPKVRRRLEERIARLGALAAAPA
ncbi:MAG TPA: GNAT family N-acetyltransferase [Candidatus Limnocylindrales bacterium]